MLPGCLAFCRSAKLRKASSGFSISSCSWRQKSRAVSCIEEREMDTTTINTTATIIIMARYRMQTNPTQLQASLNPLPTCRTWATTACVSCVRHSRKLGAWLYVIVICCFVQYILQTQTYSYMCVNI